MKKRNWIVRFTGDGALLLAIIGLILVSPLSASGQDALPEKSNSEAVEVGEHHFGAMHAGPHRFGNGLEGRIKFFEIVLDLSADQVKEIEPILAEHNEKMAEIRGDRMGARRKKRMNRMHRRDRCDNVDRTEMRANKRRQRRELEKERAVVRVSVERNREELDKKLEKVLDDDQMKKLRELRELREDHREQRQELREERRERRGRKA